jgi:hypothetical protein
MTDLRGERLQIMPSPEELALVDDFRFEHRVPTRRPGARAFAARLTTRAVEADG